MFPYRPSILRVSPCIHYIYRIQTWIPWIFQQLAIWGYNEVMSQQGWFYDLADLNQSVPFAPWTILQQCRWSLELPWSWRFIMVHHFPHQTCHLLHGTMRTFSIAVPCVEQASRTYGSRHWASDEKKIPRRSWPGVIAQSWTLGPTYTHVVKKD